MAALNGVLPCGATLHPVNNRVTLLPCIEKAYHRGAVWSYHRHLQQPHQQRQQVLGRGCPGAWGGASICAACLFLISTPLHSHSRASQRTHAVCTVTVKYSQMSGTVPVSFSFSFCPNQLSVTSEHVSKWKWFLALRHVSRLTFKHITHIAKLLTF